MPVSGPAAAQITLYQGDDFAAIADILNADGTPADLTGYVVLAQLRRAAADEAITVEVEFATTIAGSAISLTLTHDQTGLMNGRYFWDLELTGLDGIVTTVLAGQVTVVPEVSRALAPLAVGGRRGVALARR